MLGDILSNLSWLTIVLFAVGGTLLGLGLSWSTMKKRNLYVCLEKIDDTPVILKSERYMNLLLCIQNRFIHSLEIYNIGGECKFNNIEADIKNQASVNLIRGKTKVKMKVYLSEELFNRLSGWITMGEIVMVNINLVGILKGGIEFQWIINVCYKGGFSNDSDKISPS